MIIRERRSLFCSGDMAASNTRIFQYRHLRRCLLRFEYFEFRAGNANSKRVAFPMLFYTIYVLIKQSVNINRAVVMKQ